MEDPLIECPFCYEDDFDLIGLKAHLLRGHCDEFNKAISPEQERQNAQPKARN